MIIKCVNSLLGGLLNLFTSDCTRGKHVWDNRYSSIRVLPDGTLQNQIHRRCQLCFVSVYEWEK